MADAHKLYLSSELCYIGYFFSVSTIPWLCMLNYVCLSCTCACKSAMEPIGLLIVYVNCIADHEVRVTSLHFHIQLEKLEMRGNLVLDYMPSEHKCYVHSTSCLFKTKSITGSSMCLKENTFTG